MAIIHGTNFNDNNTRQGIPFFETFIREINRATSSSGAPLAISDEIYGLAGNDIIKAGSADDVIYGDRSSSQHMSVGLSGDDLIYAGGGNDTVYGDNGNDRIHGESGMDSLHGGSGQDSLYGGTGADRLQGDSGDDVLYGDDSGSSTSGGNDVLQGQSVSSLRSTFEKDVLTG
jgi:Ca2+-binding RTX toxin-like protein